MSGQLLSLIILLSLIAPFIGTSACSRLSEKDFTAGQSSEVFKKNVRLTLATDKQTYIPNQTVNIFTKIENLTSQPISYTMMNIGDPAIHVYLEPNSYAKRRELYEKGRRGYLITPSVISKNLDADANIARVVVWDQSLDTFPDKIQAPSGVYTIKALFFVGENSGDRGTQALTTTVSIRIEDALDIITPDQAQRIALKVPEVQQWWSEHSGPNIIRIENEQSFILFEMGWQSVDPSFESNGLNLEQLAKIEPEVDISMEENVWEIHFVSHFGSVPNEMHIRIDAITGEVLD